MDILVFLRGNEEPLRFVGTRNHSIKDGMLTIVTYDGRYITYAPLVWEIFETC